MRKLPLSRTVVETSPDRGRHMKISLSWEPPFTVPWETRKGNWKVFQDALDMVSMAHKVGGTCVWSPIHHY